MLEGEYLELCDQLKEKYEKHQIEMNLMKIKNKQLIKELITSYGMIRLIDNLTEETMIEMQIKIMIESLRSHLSNIFDNYSLDSESEEDID